MMLQLKTLVNRLFPSCRVRLLMVALCMFRSLSLSTCLWTRVWMLPMCRVRLCLRVLVMCRTVVTPVMCTWLSSLSLLHTGLEPVGILRWRQWVSRVTALILLWERLKTLSPRTTHRERSRRPRRPTKDLILRRTEVILSSSWLRLERWRRLRSRLNTLTYRCVIRLWRFPLVPHSLVRTLVKRRILVLRLFGRRLVCTRSSENLLLQLSVGTTMLLRPRSWVTTLATKMVGSRELILVKLVLQIPTCRLRAAWDTCLVLVVREEYVIPFLGAGVRWLWSRRTLRLTMTRFVRFPMFLQLR